MGVSQVNQMQVTCIVRLSFTALSWSFTVTFFSGMQNFSWNIWQPAEPLSGSDQADVIAVPATDRHTTGWFLWIPSCKELVWWCWWWWGVDGKRSNNKEGYSLPWRSS